VNFLFTLKNKKTSLFLLCFSLSACQNIKTRHEIETQVPSALKRDVEQAKSSDPLMVTGLQERSDASPFLTAPAPSSKENGNKIAIILGPGGLRSYAHIGVLQELVKAKIPIYSISGMEMGSLVAGLFAKKGQANDVEWQMMKLKEEEFFKKNLVLSRTSQEVTTFNEFIRSTFGGMQAEEAKIHFSCPAFNVAKRQIYVMNRGPMSSLLPYCIPYYPFFKPYQQNIAGLTSLVTMVKHLKTLGVNYIVYIDLLNDKSVPFFSKIESEENVTWSMVAQGLDQQLSAVNKVVPIALANIDLDDFAKRRDMIQKGQEAGRNLVRELQSELGY